MKKVEEKRGEGGENERKKETKDKQMKREMENCNKRGCEQGKGEILTSEMKRKELENKIRTVE